MDRKELKQAGKNLFKKNYWHSVLVAFLMLLGSGEGGYSSSSNSSSSDSYFDSIFGNSGSGVGLTYTSTEGSSLSIFDSLLGISDIERLFTSPLFIVLIISIVVLLILSYFVFMPLRCGGIRYFLKSRKNHHAELKETTENFKDKTYLNIAKVTFFRDLYTFFWTLLFIIPGIIKMFEYWAVDFILAVRPDIDKDEARRLSKILMDGNKAELFVLELSFFGWLLLSAFTFGILGIFYVNPYMQATFVEFFSDIRLQALAKGTITPNDIPDYEFYNSGFEYQPPYAQPENNPFAPNGIPTGNTDYIQQPQQNFGVSVPQTNTENSVENAIPENNQNTEE